MMSRPSQEPEEGPARQAAHHLVYVALGAKISADLGRYDDATAEAERAGAAVVLLLAAIAAAKKRKRT